MCESMVESPLWNWATMWSCESQLIFLGCISSPENNIIDLSYDWSWNETMHLKYQIQGLPNFKPYRKTYTAWPHIPVEPKKVELIEADTECWLPEIGGRGNKGDVNQRIHHFGHAGGLGSRDLRNSIVTVHWKFTILAVSESENADESQHGSISFLFPFNQIHTKEGGGAMWVKGYKVSVTQPEWLLVSSGAMWVKGYKVSVTQPEWLGVSRRGMWVKGYKVSVTQPEWLLVSNGQLGDCK